MSTLGDLFQPIKTHEEPRPKRIGAKTNSIALIAANNGKGCILAHDGSGIESDVDDMGVGDLDLHGLDDAPDGLSIWEGRLHVAHINTPDCNEWEHELIGEFRELDEAEWALFRATGVPWAFEPTEPSSEEKSK